MGFISDSQDELNYKLEITAEPKLVRPATSKPQSIWVHKIGFVGTTGPDGKMIVTRGFKYEVCTSTGRSGAGCMLCTSQDPLWVKLEPRNQVNSRGQRADFPKTCRYVMPVFDHSTSSMRVLDGGKQVYEEMDKWCELQSSSQQDLRKCDWQIWKKGEKMTTEYKTMRMDATPFVFTPDLVEEARQLMVNTLSDYKPTNPQQLLALINGREQLSLPANTNAVVFNYEPVLPSLPPTVVQPAMVAQSSVVTKSDGALASKDALDKFTVWINQQSEFAGMGLLNTFLPTLTAVLGHVEYSKCTPEQLVAVQNALDVKLAELRVHKS